MKKTLCTLAGTQTVATTVILQQLASGIVTLLAMLVVHFLPVRVG